MASTRSLRPRSPEPVADNTPPAPSSTMSARTWPFSRTRTMLQFAAPLCRMTLVTPSRIAYPRTASVSVDNAPTDCSTSQPIPAARSAVRAAVISVARVGCRFRHCPLNLLIPPGDAPDGGNPDHGRTPFQGSARRSVAVPPAGPGLPRLPRHGPRDQRLDPRPAEGHCRSPEHGLSDDFHCPAFRRPSRQHHVRYEVLAGVLRH